MRALAVLLALGACTADPAPEPELDLGGPLVPRALRVVVATGYQGAISVWLYVDDPLEPSQCNYGHFAEPGACVNNSDGRHCPARAPAACIREVALLDGDEEDEEIDRWRSAEMNPAGPFFVRAPDGRTPTDLLVRGCGAIERIPLTTGGPLPHLTARRTAPPEQHLQLSWTTDRPSATAIVGSSGGDECHVTGTFWEFSQSFTAYAQASVFAFDPPARVSTMWGVVDVYTGGVDSVTVPL